MIYILIFIIGCMATGCTLTGAVLIGMQEEKDFTDRQDARDQRDASAN